MASKKAPPFLKKGAKKGAPGKMPKMGMKKSGKSGSKC